MGASSRDAKQGYERFAFEADKTLQKRGDMGATAQLEINTSKDLDGRAMREQVLRQAVERADGFDDDKKYRGTNAYVDYRAGFRREQTIASEKGRGAHGPMRAATNIRSTFVMDYKPDICKDYKETGFCGFGDTCIYLHDRGDTKSGWQMEQEYEEKKRREEERGGAATTLPKAQLACSGINIVSMPTKSIWGLAIVALTPAIGSARTASARLLACSELEFMCAEDRWVRARCPCTSFHNKTAKPASSALAQIMREASARDKLVVDAVCFEDFSRFVM